MVISPDLWRRHFGGRTDIVGRSVQLRHYGSVEIVGVIHDGFDLSMFGGMECWFPDNRPAVVEAAGTCSPSRSLRGLSPQLTLRPSWM
jgi:hypothetical protein